MIASPSREADRALRLKYLEQMKKDLAEGLVKTTKWGGAMAKLLGDRIATHDYSEEDELERKQPIPNPS